MDRLIQNLWKPTWLQHAWEQIFMSLLKPCLTKPLLKVKFLRERYWEIWSTRALIRFPSCKNVVNWNIKDCRSEELQLTSLSTPLYIVCFPSCELLVEQITVLVNSIIQRTSYKVWIEQNLWGLPEVRWYIANISPFLALNVNQNNLLWFVFKMYFVFKSEKTSISNTAFLVF